MTAANAAAQLELDNPERRNRATVAFRGLLVIPQWVVMMLVAVAVAVSVLVGWFIAIVTGRIPAWVHTFAGHFVAYQARVNAYMYLLTDRYPPFEFIAPSVTNYPVQVELPERGQLDRARVFFRWLIAIPAAIVGTVLVWGYHVVGFFVWLLVLIKGRMPQPAFDATAAMLRFLTRYHAWLNLLTDAYPTSEVYGDKHPDAVEQRAQTRPLVLSRGGKRLLTTLIVAGAIAYPAYMITNQFYIQPALQHALIQQMQHMPHR